MRKGLLCSVATALVGAGTALAQPPSYLPGPSALSSAMSADTPVLLPAEPAPAVVADDPGLTGGSTGLRPGVDRLPEPCDVCKSAPRLYGELAYFLTWIKDGPRNFPLAIATPALGGGIGLTPGTVFFGNDDVEYDGFNGVRGTAGVWLDRRATYGVEASGFLLEQRSDVVRLAHDGAVTNPIILARPVINAATGVFTPIPVALPGASAGSVVIDSSSRLWGAEGNLVYNFRSATQSRLDLLAGFRYLDLRETLGVVSVSQPLSAPGASLTTADLFDCRNQFYGGQVGSRWLVTRGRLLLTLTSKIALGYTHEVVQRAGTSVFTAPPLTVPVGLLVGPSNAGREVRDRFAYLPETTVQLGYRLTEHLNAFVGYNFLYLSSVARPGDQVDPVVSLATIAGEPLTRPAGGINGSEFYAHSLMFGMGYQW